MIDCSVTQCVLLLISFPDTFFLKESAVRYFMLLLTNFRDKIKPYLKKKKRGGAPKNRALGKGGAGKYALFIMEDRMLHITGLQTIPCIHINISCRTSVFLM